MSYRPTDQELHAAIVELKTQLDEMFKPSKYGFSYEARCWVDGVEDALDFMAEKLVERNE